MNKKAFTLVELIVVITILAILGTIAFLSLQGYSRDARDGKRISDIGNIKKSLELFLIQTGKYPLPDNAEEVTYSGEIVWQQGTIGDNVLSQLSRNLKKKPTDPSTDSEYTYSTLNSQVAYEVVAVYEGSISENTIINQTHAADTSYVKVDGTYNELYVQTASFIIPTPSLITAESLPLVLDSTNIRSQVVTGQLNRPSGGTSNVQTGGLDITLSVYTGSITSSSTQQEKLDAIAAIQSAYTGTTLSTRGSYQTLLAQTSTGELVAFVETVVLNSPNGGTASALQGVSVSGTCGSDNGQSLGVTPTNLCTTGAATSVTDNGVGSTYTWNCNGSNGGTTANCSANHIALSCSSNASYVYNSHTYSVPQLNNGSGTTITSANVSENNGTFTYDLTLTCTNGSYTGESEASAVNVGCDGGYTWNGSSCVASATINWGGRNFSTYAIRPSDVGNPVGFNTVADICFSYGKTAAGSSWNSGSHPSGYCRPENRSFYTVTGNCNWCNPGSVTIPSLTGHSSSVVQPCHVAPQAQNWNGSSWVNRGSGGASDYGNFVSGDQVLCAD